METKDSILIVDDDESTCRTLALTLAKKGYDADTAGTGLAAVERVRRRFFNVVLLDIKLPDIEGIDLLAPLKKARPDMLVLMMTGYVSLQSAVQALNAGASAYMTKPLDMDEVLAKVGDALEKQRLVMENRRLYQEARRELAERTRAEQRLQALLRLHETTMAAMPLSLLVLDASLNVVMANRHYLAERGVGDDDVVGKSVQDVFPASVLAQQSLLEQVQTIADNGGERELVDIRDASGGCYDRRLNVRICGVESPKGQDRGPRVLLVIEDVTQQRALEEQLRQAAKMESVGKLAGGVAHDFNNLLTGIKGYTQFLLQQVEDDSRSHHDLTQIRDLADRAANVTRQLLAFSRRQPLEPVAVDVNDMVENTVKMLQRLIGEDVDLRFVPAPDLGLVRADPGGVGQVLMNLAVNARDAMMECEVVNRPSGGDDSLSRPGNQGSDALATSSQSSVASPKRLTIETANVTLDQQYADTHAEVEPGPYVRLMVTDNGIGMDQATQRHIFEPFFTTKDVGKGTGLGLATVYGIVKQHHGHVSVHSEPGSGTTFTVDLPRVDHVAQQLPAKTEGPPVPRGTETILIVEDEESLLEIAHRVLQEQGYTVFSANHPNDAEALFARHGSGVVLLVTDLVMPGCSGRELFERLAAEHPTLKVLYMSGYTEEAAVLHGVVEPSMAFIRKPFSPDTLARKVRHVLDE